MTVGPTARWQAQGVYVDVPGVHVGVGDRYHHRRYHDYDYRGERLPSGFRAETVRPIKDRVVRVGGTVKHRGRLRRPSLLAFSRDGWVCQYPQGMFGVR
jgi:hypothetical protein